MNSADEHKPDYAVGRIGIYADGGNRFRAKVLEAQVTALGQKYVFRVMDVLQVDPLDDSPRVGQDFSRIKRNDGKGIEWTFN